MGPTTSSCGNLLAKDNKKCLEQHTREALELLKKCFVWMEPNFERTSQQTKINKDELRSRIFATVYLHDIGKAENSIQQALRNKEKPKLPHALFSLPFVLACLPPLKLKKKDYYVEALTVMSHHTPFYYNLYRERHQDLSFSRERYAQGTIEFYKMLVSEHRRFMNREFPFELKEPKLSLKAEDLLDKIANKDQFYSPPPELREVFSLFTACLHYADWLSSGGKFGYDYSVTDMSRYVLRFFKKKNWGPNHIQQNMLKAKGNVVLQAPCGKGKTEAALLWASNNSQSNKLLYLLPTRVTTNAMYFRLKNLFSKENVGVSHGTSVLLLAEESGWELESYRSKQLLSSAFMQPVTVATVDQLLLAQFNWRHWELLHQNAQNSVMIFDEIHSYSPYTAALILKTAEEYKAMGVKFAFLSATLPTFLRKKLEQILGEIIYVFDPRYDKLNRHMVTFVDAEMEDLIDDVIKDYKKGKKILVIMNTVGNAMKMFDLISNKFPLNKQDILLYHSQFIEKDRREKEKILIKKEKSKKGFIAITTQVVEVSLDIDYDVLYTETAPLDALVQRMGRVNRKGLKNPAKVILAKPSKNSEKVYGKKNIQRAVDVCEKFNELRLKEEDVKKLLDTQYPPEESGENLENELEKISVNINEVRDKLWYIQTIQLGSEDIALRRLIGSREENLPTIDVVPKIFEEEIKKLSDPVKILQYIVRIPIYKFHNQLQRSEYRYIVDIDYNFEKGVLGPAQDTNIL